MGLISISLRNEHDFTADASCELALLVALRMSLDQERTTPLPACPQTMCARWRFDGRRSSEDTSMPCHMYSPIFMQLRVEDLRPLSCTKVCCCRFPCAAHECMSSGDRSSEPTRQHSPLRSYERCDESMLVNGISRMKSQKTWEQSPPIREPAGVFGKRRSASTGAIAGGGQTRWPCARD
jgi:hypothetical protein